METCACLNLDSDNCCTYVKQICDWYDHDMLDCSTAHAFCRKNETEKDKIQEHVAAKEKIEKLFDGKLEECSKFTCTPPFRRVKCRV